MFDSTFFSLDYSKSFNWQASFLAQFLKIFKLLIFSFNFLNIDLTDNLRLFQSLLDKSLLEVRFIQEIFNAFAAFLSISKLRL